MTTHFKKKKKLMRREKTMIKLVILKVSRRLKTDQFLGERRENERKSKHQKKLENRIKP